MMNRDSILKPHYQLLGLLMERCELKSALMATPQARPRNRMDCDKLAERLTLLDRDIYQHYDRVVKMFKSSGRSVHDLELFFGSDLNEELDAALEGFDA